MNRKHKKIIGMFVGTLLMLCTISFPCFAEGTTTIHMSSANVSVGDTLSVTVTASESGKISLRYNDQVLKFSGSSASYTTDGNTITFEGTTATLEFTGLSQGSSGLIVSSPTITGSSASVQVNGTAAETTEPSSQDTTNQAQTAEGQFEIDGVSYVVSERYAENMIPTGFSRTGVKIDGYTYKELSNGTITLLYLKRADNIAGDGSFYQYDEASHTVTPFAMLGTADKYVVLATPQSLLRDSFTETTLTVGEQTVTAYKDGDDGDFYFVYGTNQDGVEGWFQYDKTDASIQRVNEQLLTQDTASAADDDNVVTTTGKDEYLGKWQKQRYLVAILLFVIVVLAVVIINLLLSRKQRMDDDWADTDDDADDEMENQADAEKHASFEDIAETVADDDDISDDEIDDIDDIEEEKASLFAKWKHNRQAQVLDDEDYEEEETPEEHVPVEEIRIEKEDTIKTSSSEEVPVVEEANSDRRKRKQEPQEPIYSDIKGTEAFQSKENTRYKGADVDAQLDILDLNDL